MSHDPFLDGPRPGGCGSTVAVAAVVVLLAVVAVAWDASTAVGVLAIAAFPAAIVWGLVWTARHRPSDRHEFDDVEAWAEIGRTLKGGR